MAIGKMHPTLLLSFSERLLQILFKVINGFDEQEIDPVVVDVTQSNDEENGPIIELIKKIIGEPRNYGLSQEEKEELARKELAEREAREALERQTKEKHEREEREKRKKNIEIWTQQLQEVRKQEKEMLEAKARPFRQYIMAHVMPTLTAGESSVMTHRILNPYLGEIQ